MTSCLFRHLICLFLILGLACGFIGFYVQKRSIQAQSHPHWAILKGGK